jgi:hypothetical protein
MDQILANLAKDVRFQKRSSLCQEQRGDSMVTTIELKHLSRQEKLMIMESIWDDLSRDENLVESPDWHREALIKTEKLLNSGKLRVVDWNEAKKTLRKRFE